MKPVHEILEAAKPYLTHDVNEYVQPHKSHRICSALYHAHIMNEITVAEYEAGCNAVQDEIRIMAPHSMFLRLAAIHAGILPWDTDIYSAKYIKFRDHWLEHLIAKHRMEATK